MESETLGESVKAKGQGQRQEQVRQEGQSQRSDEVEMMNPEELFAHMKEMSEMVTHDVIALGLMIRHALLRAPTNWGSAARKQI